MSLDEYVDTQQKNFVAIKESPHYSRLIDTVDRLYRTTIDLVPAHCPRVCFGKMLLDVPQIAPLRSHPDRTGTARRCRTYQPPSD
jgi:hypothetical protein